MASDTVQQVKDRLSIVDVVSQYVKLDSAGSTLRARCPFHSEETPSFMCLPNAAPSTASAAAKAATFLHSCEKIEGLDFKGALKVLADKAGVEIATAPAAKEKKDDRERLFELMETATIYYQGKLSEEAKKYLHGWGLHEHTIKEFRLGFAGAGWTEASDFLKKKGFSEKR